MGILLDEVETLRQFIKTYGEFTEVSTLEEVQQAAQETIWTLWSGGNDFLANGYFEDEEVISYFLTPKPWVAETGALKVVFVYWVDCPTCETQSENEDWDVDDCPLCEGDGTLSIDLRECLDAQSEEQIWARLSK